MGLAKPIIYNMGTLKAGVGPTSTTTDYRNNIQSNLCFQQTPNPNFRRPDLRPPYVQTTCFQS